jgi:SlyX protein
MDEQRLIELEIKISHQDVEIEELHQVVYKQQEAIDQLETKLKSLTERFHETIGVGPTVGPGNEKPPHY